MLLAAEREDREAPRRPVDGLVEALHRSRLEELDELHRGYRPRRRRSLLLGWLGAWLRRSRRAAVEPLPAVARGQVAITWGGHATCFIRYAGLGVVCDPMLSGHVGVVPRAVQPGLQAAELAGAELVLVSHAHPDHLHVPTLRRMPRGATIVVPPRCAELVSRIGFARVIELGLGQSIAVRGVEVASAPVRHPGDGRGVCSYVLRGDGPSVYFCAASGYFSGFAEIGRRHRPDIALLPIGGYLALGGDGFREMQMSPLDALFAFEDLGSRLLVPIRYGTFPLSYEQLDEPLDWFRRLVLARDLEEHVAVIRSGASRRFVLPSR